jgi:hypothetical protein
VLPGLPSNRTSITPSRIPVSNGMMPLLIYPPMNFDAEFRADGSGTFSIPYTFTWRCSGGAVTVVWSTGGMNRIRILGDGNRLSITMTECATPPMCHMGATFAGARR